MIYHNRYKYGHTKARGSWKGVCKNFREDDHTSDKTSKCSYESKCANCGEVHMVGINDCQIEKKERIIKKMQADRRVGRRSALQILAGEDESPRSNPHSYPTHFRWKMDPEKKMKLGPWAIEKSFTQEIGSKPATVKIEQRIYICRWNLKRKRKQNFSYHKIIMLFTLKQNGLSWNIRLRQNQPMQRPDLHPRL